MKFLVDIEEDLSYYQISLEKQAFRNTKDIPAEYNGAKLAFINSNSGVVFYQKQKEKSYE